MLILLYGCTTWTLTKHMEKKLDGNYTRMLWAILNKSWRQHPIKQQLYSHLSPIMKTIQVKQTRHAGHCWRSKDEPISDIPLHMDEQRQDDQLEPIYNSSVPIQDIALKTSLERWTIERDGERWSGRYVLAVWHHDDDSLDEIYEGHSIRPIFFKKAKFFFPEFFKIKVISASFEICS